jgi:heme-degrading monooxygenase HmoA
MIVRIFQVTTCEGAQERFRAFMEQTAVPLMKSQKGLKDITFCTARPESPREFAIVMVWESLEALKDFVGEDWSRPHIDPAEEGIVESRRLRHYDLLPT